MKKSFRHTLAEVNALCSASNAAMQLKRPQRTSHPTGNTTLKGPPKPAGTLLQQYASIKNPEERFKFFQLHSHKLWALFLAGGATA